MQLEDHKKKLVQLGLGAISVIAILNIIFLFVETSALVDLYDTYGIHNNPTGYLIWLRLGTNIVSLLAVVLIRRVLKAELATESDQAVGLNH